MRKFDDHACFGHVIDVRNAANSFDNSIAMREALTANSKPERGHPYRSAREENAGVTIASVNRGTLTKVQLCVGGPSWLQ